MSSRATVTACIITRDEAARLPDCLAGVDFCDEVIVVDCGSRDGTRALARRAGARVFEQAWRGFPAQRNVALDHATSEWVLEVDADERITPPLRTEIEAFLAAPPPGVDIAGLPLRDRFLGTPLGASAKYPKYRHRLFRRGAYRHDEGRTVHERLVPRGPVHPFAGDLEHLLAGSWGEALRDAWVYVRLEVGQMAAPRTPLAVLKGTVLRPGAKLAYRVLIDGGWRDGPHGLARIGLDVASDVAVWTLHAAGSRGAVTGRSGVAADRHYGSWRLRTGTHRLVGLAFGSPASQRAREWLGRASADGADVTLVGDSEAGAAAHPVRTRLVAYGPLSVIRALEAEDQLRTVDRVVPFGRRARLLLRVVPPHLRGIEEAG